MFPRTSKILVTTNIAPQIKMSFSKSVNNKMIGISNCSHQHSNFLPWSPRKHRHPLVDSPSDTGHVRYRPAETRTGNQTHPGSSQQRHYYFLVRESTLAWTRRVDLRRWERCGWQEREEPWRNWSEWLLGGWAGSGRDSSLWGAGAGCPVAVLRILGGAPEGHLPLGHCSCRYHGILRIGQRRCH